MEVDIPIFKSICLLYPTYTVYYSSRKINTRYSRQPNVAGPSLNNATSTGTIYCDIVRFTIPFHAKYQSENVWIQNRNTKNLFEFKH